MTQRIQLDNLLKRLGATLFILIIYVLGCTIPLPLVNISTTFRQILANSSMNSQIDRAADVLEKCSVLILTLGTNIPLTYLFMI